MAIQILPARLANQIAAGEVVERPASVVKELVENSLDAGATRITIDIEKGGAKRIRISDNGSGIVKDELTLALSRHATSKIKDLDDLEAIASLGFRGEALASISSVARLTITSKPQAQDTAWQAFAQGRDMEVTVQPAAHPDGTTIEVDDLFFNTPARRKFLRTEKTEFSHIDEVIRRIALARFDVAFTLTHNGKAIRQYRALTKHSDYGKRVGQVCGQKFIDNALVIDCRHDGLHFWGWLGKPATQRNQNDLSYSYVNGRMMRDKLINHGIRQAFSELIDNDSYPAFVLYLELEHREVDVNVHPAKHEVRFHQGRYVHDFIYSVCAKALQESLASEELALTDTNIAGNHFAQEPLSSPQSYSAQQSGGYASPDYIKPLQQIKEPSNYRSYQQYSPNHNGQQLSAAAEAYRELLATPNVGIEQSQDALTAQATPENTALERINTQQLLYITAKHYALVDDNDQLKLVNLLPLAYEVNRQLVEQKWQQGLVSQPLLLPVIVNVEKADGQFINQQIGLLEQAGIVVQVQSATKVQVRQFPAILRAKDVATSFSTLIEIMQKADAANESLSDAIKQELAKLVMSDEFNLITAKQLWIQAQSLLPDKLNALCDLNSCKVDLTSAITQLR
ncbi:DNA mismatch repair endonuclease MutL [Colwellia sp. MEBiC06753]